MLPSVARGALCRPLPHAGLCALRHGPQVHPATSCLHVKARNARSCQTCRAGNSNLPAQLRPLLSSNITQGGVALVILAAVDAAYSGDWSRIEVISKQDELWLQSALKALAAWHVVNAIAAYVIADQNDKSKVPLIPKVLAIGTVPLLALILEMQEDT